ncbi:MAG: F0F1 ATP synthase subunit delta [Pseudomonadota bacterium]|nr:F0F1 ATP synthase subunit delta [Pseudomonadota bacterium]MEC8664042.1 F0F1 ATP synthase subunit delta [Pseudomonadota bacterium]
MAAGSSKNNLVARRYASALLDMADEAKSVEKIEKDMLALEAMLEGSEDLQRLIENPLMSSGAQQNGILAIATKAKFQKLTQNFLGVLVQNRRLGALPQVINAMKAELRTRRGEVEAKVVSAYALTPAQTNALQKDLSKAMGTNVTLSVEVDKELLGGMTVTVGSQMIDDSVRSKLDRLKRAMSSGSNQNQVKLEEVG